MKKVKYFIFSLICLFSCSIVYAENEVVIKSITPVYDEESSVIVTEIDDEHNVIFNDKDQSVKYNVVIENTSNKDLSVQGIKLSTPSEAFLKYELDGLKNNDVVKADSTKEVVISLSTVKQDGWGRNFDDELTATINFGDPIANPNTGTSEVIIVILICGVLISCAFIVICRKKKITRYIVILLAFGSVITVTSAKESFVLPIKINVGYESQNVMTTSGYYDYVSGENVYNPHLFWVYNWGIKNIYFETNIIEPSDYVYKYDVSEKQNGRVMSYLVTNEKDEKYYDLFIQAEGIIYANTDARYYFGEMWYLDSINDLENLDTSNVELMDNMFKETGENSQIFTLDLSNFNTSNVKSMNSMFNGTGFFSRTFTLDVSGFDTSNVKSMDNMFKKTGYYSENFTLDVSNFNTSNVETMGGMFDSTGSHSEVFTLDLSNFDTSNVTSMAKMFYRTGDNSTNFTLDVSNLDTSNVLYMHSMFEGTGRNSTKLNTSITIRHNKSGYRKFYTDIFKNSVLDSGSQIIVNYTSETSEMVDEMIATAKTEVCVEGNYDECWNYEEVNCNVVKGRNVDLETISFTIDGTTYYAEEGMTWEKWIGSVYNTDGYYLFDGNLPTSPNRYNISGVMASDEIVKDAIYNLDSVPCPA